MLKPGHFALLIISVIALNTCIDPYKPRINEYKSYLVIEGLITDEAAPYTIKLSRTIMQQDAKPALETDANVYIADEESNIAQCISQGDGTYVTDGHSFRGVPGKHYTLHIKTGDGKEYESDPCLMEPVGDIDSIYFVKEEKLANNNTQTQVGLSIYIDSRKGVSNNYYRWAYEETWKFKVPTPKKFDYINDSTIIPIQKVSEFGWKSFKSEDVLIHSFMFTGSDRITKEPITFIAPKLSDRFTMEYSILVKQYSISKNEYNFWNSMVKVNNSGADIFASQPFPVISNIHNIDDKGEEVLGYFQVSAMKQKRKYITFREIIAENLPVFHYPCERIVKEPKDYDMSWGKKTTWNDVYNMFCVNQDYYFVEPLYLPGTLKLSKLVFAKPECADSRVSGTDIKPDFWIDLN